MTFSHSVTIAGWIVIVVVIATAAFGSVISHGRFPSAVALVRRAVHNLVVRVILLAGWAWVGWHFFVRTTR